MEMGLENMMDVDNDLPILNSVRAWIRRALRLLGNASCCQPETVRVPAELTILPAVTLKLLFLLTGAWAPITGSCVNTLDSGLPHPSGEGFRRTIQSAGNFPMGEVVPPAEINSLRFLLRRVLTSATASYVVNAG